MNSPKNPELDLDLDLMLAPNARDSFMKKLEKRMAHAIMSRGQNATWLSARKFIDALQKPITDLAVAESYSIELQQIINDFKAKHPDLKDSEIKSMDSLVCILTFQNFHKIISENKILKEKLNFKNFTDLLNNLDDEEFDFYYFGMMIWYFVEFAGHDHFRSAHVLWSCLESRHAATKAGKNRMNLKKDDFEHYLIVQDFEMKFKKFQYLYILLLEKSPEPSAFDLKTAEILKGLKGYHPESNDLPIELKTFEEVKAAGDLIIKMSEDLSAAYENYVESWEETRWHWPILSLDVNEFKVNNLMIVKAQINDTLAEYTEDNFIKCELYEKAVDHRKEARSLIPDEKLKHRMVNEQQIAYAMLDLIGYRFLIYDSDQSNKENDAKFDDTLQEALIFTYNYFCWLSQVTVNGFEPDQDANERNFTIMLLNYRFNKTMFRHPEIMKNYTKQLKIWLAKYSYLEKIYQTHCDISSDFQIDEIEDKQVEETEKKIDERSDKLIEDVEEAE
jgi:hypothetical protein